MEYHKVHILVYIYWYIYLFLSINWFRPCIMAGFRWLIFLDSSEMYSACS